MRSVKSCEEVTQLLDRWQREAMNFQDARHRQRNSRLAVMGYLTNGPVRQGLITINQIVLVLLHAALDGRLSFVGFSAEQVDWGVAWGGAVRNHFAKDLLLKPAVGARGPRLNLAQRGLARLALQLQRELNRYALHPRLRIARRFRLPRLWAGFRGPDARQLSGDGPELETVCRQTGRPPRQLLAEARRKHDGLVLLPLDWVSNSWQRMVDVYADVGRFPKRQAFLLRGGVLDLAGYRGASEFNFHESRFGQGRASSRLACA